MELCSQASGVSPCSTSVLLSPTLLCLVPNPFVDPLYYIHDEIIQFLNHVILCVCVNVLAAEDVDEGHHTYHQRCRPHVPYDEFFTVLHVFLPESAGIRSIPVDSGNSVEWKF